MLLIASDMKSFAILIAGTDTEPPHLMQYVDVVSALRLLVQQNTLLLHGIVSVSGESENEKFVEFVISPDGDYMDLNGSVIYSPHSGRKRFIREEARLQYVEGDTCRLPGQIIDFLITCKAYPNRIVCLQHCPFGFTFPEGIAREMKCWYEQDQWRPYREFERCKPFVDCTLTLGPGGRYMCYTNYLDQGNKCDISCARYEDKEAVPQKTHQCNLSGKWNPPLPRCIKAGSGLKLVRPPKGQKVFGGEVNV